MSKPSIKALRRHYMAQLDKARFRERLTGRTGPIDEATGQLTADPKVYDSDGNLIPNRIWVRFGATADFPSGREQRAVWNFGKVRTNKNDAAVELDYNSKGELEVIGPDHAAADEQYGAAANTIYQPDPASPDLDTSVYYLRAILDLRARHATDLLLYVEKGWYSKTFYAGGSIDLTAYQTATSGKHAWVVVGLDTTTGLLVADTGTDTAALVPLSLGDIVTVLAGSAFNTALPIAAVDLAAAAITFDSTHITDLRGFNPGSATVTPVFGAGVLITLASGVAVAGTDRHLILAAESSTTDTLIEITGLNVGDELIIRADAGDTITVAHNDAGATDKILLYNAADLALTGDQTMKLVKIAAGKVVQYVDKDTGGGGGGGGGGGSSRGVYGSLPGSPTDGDLYFVTDAPYLLRYNGATWDARSGDHEVTIPVLAGTWDNQGSASVDFSRGPLYFSTPGQTSGNKLRVYYKAAPATPYVVTIAFTFNSLMPNTSCILGGGLCFRSSGGNLSVMMVEFSHSGGALSCSVGVRSWVSSSSFNADTQFVTTGLALQSSPYWLRIADDGVDRIYSLASNRENFQPFYTEGRTTLFTASQVGVFLRADGSAAGVAAMNILSYEET